MKEQRRPWSWHDRPWRRRLHGSEESARGSEQGVERGMERACWCPSSSAAGRRASTTRGAAAEAHGGHVQGACRPLGRFREQLAGDDGISVGRDFGLFPGRIRTWAEYED